MNSCKEYGLPTPKIEEQNDFMDIEIVRSQDNLQTIQSKIRPITDDYGRLWTIMDDYGRLWPITTDYLKKKRNYYYIHWITPK